MRVAEKIYSFVAKILNMFTIIFFRVIVIWNKE